MRILGIRIGQFIRTPHELLGFRYHKVTAHLVLDVRDLWIGVYWNRAGDASSNALRWEVYVCVVPCLPIRVRGWI